MKLSFDIKKARISDIIECLQNESDLETRLDYFSICNDHCNDKVFNVTLESSNEFFIQRMTEAARDKSEDRKCNCLFNLDLKETTPFIIRIDREVRNFSYDKFPGEEKKEPEIKPDESGRLE